VPLYHFERSHCAHHPIDATGPLQHPIAGERGRSDPASDEAQLFWV
jgi:hypothetical protein